MLGNSHHPFIDIAPREECKGTEHLDRIFQDILDKGGEGIILRDPQSPYEAGRSKGFLKHKVTLHPSPPSPQHPSQQYSTPLQKFRDAEAKIVKTLADSHQWECELYAL